MAKKGGFPGGMGMPGNMGNLMKQAQKMQKQMQEAQEAIENATYEGTAGGGAVLVTVNGKKEILTLNISEEAVDPDDIETLQDLIIAALNGAFASVDEATSQSMGALTGGMGGFGSGLF